MEGKKEERQKKEKKKKKRKPSLCRIQRLVESAMAREGLNSTACPCTCYSVTKNPSLPSPRPPPLPLPRSRCHTEHRCRRPCWLLPPSSSGHCCLLPSVQMLRACVLICKLACVQSYCLLVAALAFSSRCCVLVRVHAALPLLVAAASRCVLGQRGSKQGRRSMKAGKEEKRERKKE